VRVFECDCVVDCLCLRENVCLHACVCVYVMEEKKSVFLPEVSGAHLYIWLGESVLFIGAWRRSVTISFEECDSRAPTTQ
jgi:hypothetical protein